jgi:hypothetical protein
MKTEQTECSETSAYKIQTPREITQKKAYNRCNFVSYIYAGYDVILFM